MTPNPFNLLENALWHILESCEVFTTLFRPGNRVKLNDADNPNPFRDSTLDDDHPRVFIMPQGGKFNFRQASDFRQIEQRYLIALKSSQIVTSTDGALNSLKWALFVAVERSRAIARRDFGTGLDLFRDITLGDFTDELPGADPENASARGWAVATTVSIIAHFPLAEVLK